MVIPGIALTIKDVSTELVIKTIRTDGIAIALLKDGKLSELHNEKEENDFSVGDIYLGRVKKLVPGLNAAFVDVGYEKDAFLHYHDLGPQVKSLTKFIKRTTTGKQTWDLSEFQQEEDIDKNGKINDVLKQGQHLLVQIAKEPISTKGPRISSEMSLAGRYIVLVPFSDRISVSQKIKEKEERARLKRLIQSIRPKGFGVIIRTVAENVKVAELDADLTNLVKKWKTCHRQLKRAKPPTKVLGEMGRASSILRDIFNDSFTSIVTDDEELTDGIREYLQNIAPDKEGIVKFYEGKVPIFEHYGIERQIKGAFGRSVSMSKGAYLIIEHTEAMHVIDVNSGNRSNSKEDQEANALAVNLLSATEIARQLRLRDMGGIIVIDFIDLHKAENRRTLYEKLKEEMSDDRAKHKILPPSRFGLVEITRQRVRPEMNIKTSEENPDGDGEVQAPILIIDDIEHQVDAIMQKVNKPICLHTHPFIAAYLTKGTFKSIQMKWFKRYKKWVTIIPRDSYKFLEYHFYDKKNKELELKEQ